MRYLFLKILLTNWINLLGVFFVTLVFSCCLTLADANISDNVYQVILAVLFLVCGFGAMAWGLFITSLVILDLILIVHGRNNLKMKLLLEWFIISIPFIYWVVKYHEWVFLISVVSFLITQLLRKQLITNLYLNKRS
jgi:hypothetical protein